MATGWAFVDCTDTGGQAAGPTGSLQFLTGANATSGSANLVYHTASAGGLPVSTLVLSGTLLVKGEVSASSFTVKNVQEIDGTGSTFFGDSFDDMHERTGSFKVFDGSVDYPFVICEPRRRGVSGGRVTNARCFILQSASFMPHYSASGQGATTVNIDTNAHIVGIQSPGNVALVLPHPGIRSGCKLLVIKDECTNRTGSITITVNGAAGKIDGEDSYELSGTMPAINLYTNGSNYFVY